MKENYIEKMGELKRSLNLFDKPSDHQFLADSKIEYIEKENVIRLTFDYSMHPPSKEEFKREGVLLISGLAKNIGLKCSIDLVKLDEDKFSDLVKIGCIEFFQS